MLITERLQRARVVPVIVLEDSSFATPLADALVKGGLECAEVTLRTPSSLEIISTLADRRDICVGAGTVLSPLQVDQAADAGAHFIVSPGLDRDVVERSQELGITVLPGVATATEVLAARRLGLSHVKFFPAVPAGGLEIIAALHGPFPDIRFMPTGGITLATVKGYLDHPAIFAVGGSWMVPRSQLDAGDFTTVERLTRETVTFLTSLSPPG